MPLYGLNRAGVVVSGCTAAVRNIHGRASDGNLSS